MPSSSHAGRLIDPATKIRSRSRILVVLALLATLLPGTAQATAVTLRLWDQDGGQLVGSQFLVNGTLVPQGGSIELTPGVHAVRIYPGISAAGAHQTADLWRDDTVNVPGSGNVDIDLQWKRATLIVDLLDQHDVRIPASQWLPSIPDSSYHSVGEALLLPVTEDPATPTLGGTCAAGYPITLCPGLNWLAQTTLLSRADRAELSPADTTAAFVWKCGHRRLIVVSPDDQELEGASFSFEQHVGSGPSGTEMLLPVTEDPSTSIIVGSLAAGYVIGIRPTLPDPYRTFTFELNAAYLFSPSQVTIGSRTVGLELAVSPPGGHTYTVSPMTGADFETVQEAIDAAAPGDTVLVGDGVYREEALDFKGKDLVVRSQNGPAVTKLELSGDIDGQIFFTKGETYRAVLRGFSIYSWILKASRAAEKSPRSGEGGAMIISGSSPTIEECVFHGNRALGSGGAVACLAGSSPTFRRCTFGGNVAGTEGGALYVAGSSAVRVERSVLWANCSSSGGQYYADGSTIWFSTCVLDTTGVHGNGRIFLESGIVTSDPLFYSTAEPCDAPSPVGVYAVCQGSPCLLPDGELLIGALGEAWAPPLVWDGGGDGNSWSDAQNWNPNRAPGIHDYVLISDGSYVNLDIDATVRNLTVEGGSELYFEGHELRVSRGGANRGDLYVDPGGSLRLDGSSDPLAEFANEGSLYITDGRVWGDAPLHNSGNITIPSSGKANRRDGGASEITVPLKMEGSIEVQQSATLRLWGEVTNIGTSNILVAKWSTLDLGADLSEGVVPCGNLTMEGGQIHGLRGLSILLNLAKTYAGSDTLGVPCTIGEGALFSMSSSGSLAINRDFVNAGQMQVSPEAIINLRMPSNESLHNAPSGSITLNDGAIAGTGRIENQGLVTTSGGGSIYALLLNHSIPEQGIQGHIDVPTGGLSATRIRNAGLITTAPSTLLSVTDSLINLPSGIIEGNGTINTLSGFFSDQGTIKPGSETQTGILRLQGDWDQGSGGMLNICIAGKVAGTEFDQVLCFGSGTTNGTLNVRLINGFTPAVGDTFPVLVFPDGGGLVGKPRFRLNGLSCFSGLDTGSGLYLSPVVTSHGVVLQASSDSNLDHRPVAANDAAATDWLSPLTISPLRNDTDPDGDSLRIARLDLTRTRGSASISLGDTTLLYLPPLETTGLDTLRYVVTDCQGKNDTALVAISLGFPPHFTLRVPSEYPTIQQAIDQAVSTDTVLIASGTYSGTGNVGLDFQGKSIVVRSSGGAEFTILDCGGTHPGVIFQHGETSAAVLQGVTITNAGQTGLWGGAVRIQGASPTIRDCLLKGNFAAQGAGVSVQNGSANLTGCTIAGNRAPDQGGGIRADASSSVTLDRCVCWGNCTSGAHPSFYIQGSASIHECAIDTVGSHGGSISYLSPNSFQSPLFCAAATCTASPQTAGDYHVDASSWCVLANNPGSVQVGALDYSCAASSGLERTIGELPRQLALGPPSPNPVRSHTRFLLSLPRADHARLAIYDVTGRVVKVLLDGRVPAGCYAFHWGLEETAERLPSGVYFARLEQGGRVEVRGLVLAR